jgi:hypothetical protein
LKYIVFEDHKTAILEAMIGKISKYSCHFRIRFSDLSAIAVARKIEIINNTRGGIEVKRWERG